MNGITTRTLAALPALALASSAAAQVTLVAHYELNETSGTVAADSSGNGNDGTYIGGYLLNQPGTCPNSTAVLFNGADSYVDIPPSASLDALLSDFTVAAWINEDMDQLHRVFGSRRDNCNAATGSWSFGPLNGGGLRFTTFGIQDFNQPSSIQIGVWHHIAVVFDANFDATFYLDGVSQGTVVGAAPPGPSTLGYCIGLLDLICFSEYFSGTIDDVQVYGGSATAQEIMDLFLNPCSTIGGGGGIGTNYCGPPVNNSTGLPGLLTAVGSTSIADNDVNFTVDQLPLNQFGYFVMGENQGFIPVGQGFLCIALPFVRFNTDILDSGAAGQMVFSPNLTALPSGTVFVPGDTWNFQCWYRDVNPGNTSNLSDAVEITFQ